MKSLFVANITPTNNQTIAPYLFAKKLVLDAIGKKQVKMILKTKAKDSHSLLVKYIFRDVNARTITITKNNMKPTKPVSESNCNEML